ncbi:MAG: hypothetical protein ABIC91_05590 [Nanoarchaeota archaeon]
MHDVRTAIAESVESGEKCDFILPDNKNNKTTDVQSFYPDYS